MQLTNGRLEEPKEYHIQLTDLLEKQSCHRQPVERCVKMMKAVSASVCGKMKREGMIRVRLQSRSMLILNTKAYYKTNYDNFCFRYVNSM